MASPNISQILTTTIENRSRVLADNVTKNNAILFRLGERGKIKTFGGGVTIRQELEYAENGTYKRYAGYDTLNISPSDVFSSAEFSIFQVAVAVSMSGLEILQNDGREQMIDLMESKIKNAERSMANGMATDMYSDGSASNQIGGLQLLVADTPTSGTVGGINRATWTFWQNLSKDATTDFSAAATAALMQSYMNRVYLGICRGTDHPDLILADNNYYRLYWESLQSIQRITNTKMAEAGFDNLKYMGADVVFDGGVGGACPTNHMYFLNTGYIFYRPHRKRNMVPLDPDRFATNQDAVVKLIGWAGNMTVSNASLQGLLKD